MKLQVDFYGLLARDSQCHSQLERVFYCRLVFLMLTNLIDSHIVRIRCYHNVKAYLMEGHMVIRCYIM